MAKTNFTSAKQMQDYLNTTINEFLSRTGAQDSYLKYTNKYNHITGIRYHVYNHMTGSLFGVIRFDRNNAYNNKAVGFYGLSGHLIGYLPDDLVNDFWRDSEGKDGQLFMGYIENGYPSIFILGHEGRDLTEKLGKYMPGYVLKYGEII